MWRRRNGGSGSGRQSDFLNLAVEEITLSHNASTLLDAPYVASSSSSSSFYRLRLLIPLLLLLCMRVRTRTGESTKYNFRLEILLSLFGSFRLESLEIHTAMCSFVVMKLIRESQRHFLRDR